MILGFGNHGRGQGAASQAGVRSPAVGSAEMRVLVNTWFLFTVIPLDSLGSRIRNLAGSTPPTTLVNRITVTRRPMTPVSVQVVSLVGFEFGVGLLREGWSG